MEERRKELLVANGQDPNTISPERLSAGGSSSTGRDGNWEQIPDPNAPPVGSSGSGAPQMGQPTTRQTPPPPPNTSGLVSGTVPQSPHSWERRRMERIFKLSSNHVWTLQLQKLCDNRQKMQVQQDSRVMVLGEKKKLTQTVSS